MGIVFATGDLVWLIFVAFWAAIWCRRLAPRWVCGFPVVIGLGVVTAHICGFKLYGVPTLAESRPLLVRPLELARLELPNIVVTTDGSRHVVRGLTFSPVYASLPTDELRFVVDRLGQTLRFAPDSAFASGYVAEHRCDYSCGNTWFPSPIPKRLPTHEKLDLAIALRCVSDDRTKIATTAEPSS